MKLIIRVIVFTAAVYEAYALCNTCSATTGLACVANDQFKVCVNGVPTSAATQCPSGTICSSVNSVCAATGSVTPACSRCGVCNGSNTFACTGLKTFALCYGTTTPSTVNNLCPGTTVCNVDVPIICVDPVVTGLGGTCPSVTTTTTTTSTTTTTTTTPAPTIPNPATSPQAYCVAMGRTGRFDIPSDATCTSYVYCTRVNNAWIGNLYQCPGTTKFNANMQLCGTGPTRCG